MNIDRNKRRNFSPEQKVAIVRQHLLDHVPVSDLCDQHGIRPNQSGCCDALRQAAELLRPFLDTHATHA